MIEFSDYLRLFPVYMPHAITTASAKIPNPISPKPIA